MSEELQIRIHGDGSLPTLIYLPGLHGDWTLVGRFRRAVENRVRFVELTYPRTLTWSLDDYAAAIEAGLKARGITRGWLLAESFSSQVAWPLIARNRFDLDGVILIGGFVRHPLHWWLRLAERLTGSLAYRLVTRLIFLAANKTFLKLYASVTRARPLEAAAATDEFLARRTPLDLKAMRHRLHLIAHADFRETAAHARVPVYALTGSFDPIVPWRPVRRWLRSHCSALREYHVLRQVDHMVLGSGTARAAEYVLNWMNPKVSEATCR